MIVGNWKCHTRIASARLLARDLRRNLNGVRDAEIAVCPTFLHLEAVRAELQGSNIAVGAQDVHWQDDVAATGEIGPEMLGELASYVIVGHSERRHQFGESDEVVAKKIRALGVARRPDGSAIRPIICVGETLEERDEGKADGVLQRQLRSALSGTQLPALTIAYEPVWAIGTGVAATIDVVAEAVDIVRKEMARLLGVEQEGQVRILYGGSVNPSNVAEFLSLSDIDGALVGGASLVADKFTAIVEQWARARDRR